MRHFKISHSPYPTRTFLSKLTSKYANAKFILSTRSSDQEWFASLCRFHSKTSHEGKWPLTWDDVKKSNTLKKEHRYEFFIHVLGSDEKEPYDEVSWKTCNNYNELIRHFFKNNPNFLGINLADTNAERVLRIFLGTPEDVTIPHKNTT